MTPLQSLGDLLVRPPSERIIHNPSFPILMCIRMTSCSYGITVVWIARAYYNFLPI